MKRRKWNKVAAGVLVTVLAFANSITVFAYRDGFEEIVPEDASHDLIEGELNSDIAVFVSNSAGEEEQESFTLSIVSNIYYDDQFIDEEGNIYPVTDPVQRGCSHTYDSGIEEKHYSKSDGGCEVKRYNAQRCTKCGIVVRGSLISTHTYVVCPH